MLNTAPFCVQAKATIHKNENCCEGRIRQVDIRNVKRHPQRYSLRIDLQNT